MRKIRERAKDKASFDERDEYKPTILTAVAGRGQKKLMAILEMNLNR